MSWTGVGVRVWEFVCLLRCLAPAGGVRHPETFRRRVVWRAAGVRGGRVRGTSARLNSGIDSLERVSTLYATRLLFTSGRDMHKHVTWHARCSLRRGTCITIAWPRPSIHERGSRATRARKPRPHEPRPLREPRDPRHATHATRNAHGRASHNTPTRSYTDNAHPNTPLTPRRRLKQPQLRPPSAYGGNLSRIEA